MSLSCIAPPHITSPSTAEPPSQSPPFRETQQAHWRPRCMHVWSSARAAQSSAQSTQQTHQDKIHLCPKVCVLYPRVGRGPCGHRHKITAPGYVQRETPRGTHCPPLCISTCATCVATREFDRRGGRRHSKHSYTSTRKQRRAGKEDLKSNMTTKGRLKLACRALYCVPRHMFTTQEGASWASGRAVQQSVVVGP